MLNCFPGLMTWTQEKGHRAKTVKYPPAYEHWVLVKLNHSNMSHINSILTWVWLRYGMCKLSRGVSPVFVKIIQSVTHTQSNTITWFMKKKIITYNIYKCSCFILFSKILIIHIHSCLGPRKDQLYKFGLNQLMKKKQKTNVLICL